MRFVLVVGVLCWCACQGTTPPSPQITNPDPSQTTASAATPWIEGADPVSPRDARGLLGQAKSALLGLPRVPTSPTQVSGARPQVLWPQTQLESSWEDPQALWDTSKFALQAYRWGAGHVVFVFRTLGTPGDVLEHQVVVWDQARDEVVFHIGTPETLTSQTLSFFEGGAPERHFLYEQRGRCGTCCETRYSYIWSLGPKGATLAFERSYNSGRGGLVDLEIRPGGVLRHRSQGVQRVDVAGFLHWTDVTSTCTWRAGGYVCSPKTLAQGVQRSFTECFSIDPEFAVAPQEVMNP